VYRTVAHEKHTRAREAAVVFGMGHAAGSQAKNSCSVFAMVFVTRRRLDRREFRRLRQRLRAWT